MSVLDDKPCHFPPKYDISLMRKYQSVSCNLCHAFMKNQKSTAFMKVAGVILLGVNTEGTENIMSGKECDLQLYLVTWKFRM